jgi:hypothetical protein
MKPPLRRFGNACLLSIGALMLVVFSFQYPFTAKIPLGNDTPTHIQIARYPISAPAYRDVAESFAPLKTCYQLPSSLFVLARFLPFTWPQRFMIWMALGHLISGLILGYLLKKIAGTIPALIGMILWASSVFGVLMFAQIGFMPQLWSMIFLLFFLERIQARSPIGAGVALIAIWFSHPGTFVVCALALAITFPQYIFSKFYCPKTDKCLSKRIIITLLSSLSLLLFLFFFKNWPTYITFEKDLGIFRTLSYILTSQIGIIIPLVPIGFFAFVKNHSLPQYFKIFLSTFGVISIVLGFNSLLGLGSLESRFFPYAIISVIILGSIGLEVCLRYAFSFAPLRYLVLFFILSIVAFQGWHTAVSYITNPETDKSYQHLQEKQMQIFQWIKQNLPENAVIAQNDSLPDGVVRWLPAISDRGMVPANYLSKNFCPTIMQHLLKSNATHVLFFTKYEKIPSVYATNSKLFEKIYDNNEAIIYKLPIAQAKNLNDLKLNPATLCAN